MHVLYLLYYVAPEGQFPPTIEVMTASSIALSIQPPTTPNGIITSYRLCRTTPALIPTNSPAIHEKGVRFHGGGYIRLRNSVFVGGLSSVLSFEIKTFETEGLLFFATNQLLSDYLAISFNSTHVQFKFDSGPASNAVINTLPTNVHDGAWHSITASRNGNSGSLEVDEQFVIASGDVGTDNNIAQSSFVFVGGISDDVTSISGLQLLSILPYAGCIRDLTIDSTIFNTTHSLSSSRTTLSLEGCPSINTTESGVHLHGTGFAAFAIPELAFNGNNFLFSFNLRTNNPSGTILALGMDSTDINTDFLLFSLISGQPKLYLRVNGNSISLEMLTGLNSLCDNEWHSVYITKSDENITLTIDALSNSLLLQTSLHTIQSNVLYFGGVDVLTAFYTKLTTPSLSLPPISSFGGCIRNILLDNFPLFHNKVTTIRNIDLDGCRTAAGLNNCANRSEVCDDITTLFINNTGLEPFRGEINR